MYSRKLKGRVLVLLSLLYFQLWLPSFPIAGGPAQGRTAT